MYDHVTLCFPASYNIFELLFQMYHINVAMVIDTIGQRAEHLSTGGSLRIMEFVRKYLVRREARARSRTAPPQCLSCTHTRSGLCAARACAHLPAAPAPCRTPLGCWASPWAPWRSSSARAAPVKRRHGWAQQREAASAHIGVARVYVRAQETLRGFGLEEALVRFPPSPNTDPDLPPGLDYLMRCYIERMETSVTKWFNNIMVVDLEVSETGHEQGWGCCAPLPPSDARHPCAGLVE